MMESHRSESYINDKLLFLSWLSFPKTEKALLDEANYSTNVTDPFWEQDFSDIKSEYRRLYRDSDLTLVTDVCVCLDLFRRYIYEVHPEKFDCIQITHLGVCVLRIINSGVRCGRCISLELSQYRRDLILGSATVRQSSWIPIALTAAITSIVTVYLFHYLYPK